MDRQTLRDWVHRFNHAGPSGFGRPQGAGPATAAGPGATARAGALLGNGPELAQDGVVRWRLIDLGALVERRFGIRYQERGMGKLVRALGFSRVSARPRRPKLRPRGANRVRKKLADRIAAAVGDQAQGRRLRALVPRTKAGIGRKRAP